MFHISNPEMLIEIGSVCIASILRLHAVLGQKNNADITWDFINQGVWAVVEADFAIISGKSRSLLPWHSSNCCDFMIRQAGLFVCDYSLSTNTQTALDSGPTEEGAY